MINRKKYIDQLLKKNNRYWIVETDEDSYILYDGIRFRELTNQELTKFRDEEEINPTWSFSNVNCEKDRGKLKKLMEVWYKKPEVPLFLDIDMESDKLTAN